MTQVVIHTGEPMAIAQYDVHALVEFEDGSTVAHLTNELEAAQAVG